jgi:hypothetical protein
MCKQVSVSLPYEGLWGPFVLIAYGLHFALLDPHNLGALSFSIIEQLAKLKHVDILVHVSVSDLQRNVDLYSSEAMSLVLLKMAKRSLPLTDYAAFVC